MRSTARLRAVTISQAGGLVGMPSRGHRSAAIANASWAASSASSKSPRKPISAARRDPTAHGRPAPGSLPIHLRGSDLDRPTKPRRRDPASQLDRGIEIIGLEHEVAPNGFLPAHDWPAGSQSLTVLDTA